MRIKQAYWLFAAFLSLSCSSKYPGGPSTFPPSKLNPADCRNKGDDGQPLLACDPGTSCDEVSGLCTGVNCSGPADCKYPDGVQCINGTCSGTCLDNQMRYVDTYCLAWNGQRPMIPARQYCRPVTTPTSPPLIVATCNECWPESMATSDLKAVGCPDPLKPTCSLQKYPKPEQSGTFYYSYTCSPCTQDSECPSGVCRKPGDYPKTSPVPGIQDGQCVPTTNIAYVNNTGTPACAMSNPGTQTQPVCNVAQAMSLTGKAYINVVGSATPYPAINVASGTFVVVGPGRDAATPARFPQVNVTGGSLVLSGVRVESGMMTAVTCSGGAASSLYVLDSNIIALTNGRGIDGELGCGQFNVERCRVEAGRHAIVVSGVVSKYRIVNTAVTHTNRGGSGGEPYGVRIGTDASGYFGFNTVTRYQGGVVCESSQPIEASIVSDNLNSPQVNNCDTTGRHVYEGPVAFSSNLDPKLIDNTANTNCCVDQVEAPSSNETVPNDFYGTARPQGMSYDIGFHELK